MERREEDYCVFCRILKKEIPAQFLKESEFAYSIRDMHSQAKEHLLIISKQHVKSLNDLTTAQRSTLLPAMYDLADQMAKELQFPKDGYRTVINNQEIAGQSVFHLHMHVLAGEPLKGQFGAR